MKIDAHQHFWRYSPADFGWIDERMGPLRRDFLPADLHREITGVGVDGVVAVQARQSLAETDWLLELASRNPFIRGVVGWVPLESGDVVSCLTRFAENPALKGVRHVVQDEPDEEFLARPRFNAGVAALRKFKLVYDVLIFERQLPQAIAFVDRHPEQSFVLDHLAKPKAASQELQPWADRVRELARRENVVCKVSGLVTEAIWNDWSEAQLGPYLDVVVDAFGPRRLMFGSDWPVCLLATSYARWVGTVERWAAKLADEERVWLFGQTAARIYGLSSVSN
jgi:L-fuconolactonase